MKWCRGSSSCSFIFLINFNQSLPITKFTQGWRISEKNESYMFMTFKIFPNRNRHADGNALGHLNFCLEMKKSILSPKFNLGCYKTLVFIYEAHQAPACPLIATSRWLNIASDIAPVSVTTFIMSNPSAERLADWEPEVQNIAHFFCAA